MPKLWSWIVGDSVSSGTESESDLESEPQHFRVSCTALRMASSHVPLKRLQIDALEFGEEFSQKIGRILNMGRGEREREIQGLATTLKALKHPLTIMTDCWKLSLSICLRIELRLRS